MSNVARTIRERDFQKGLALGFAVVLAVLGVLGIVWMVSPHGPAYAVIENDRSEDVIIQLGGSDQRAWAVPPGGFGPTVQVEVGTPARLLTAECELIKEVVIHAGGQGFVLRADGTVVEMPFGDISQDAQTHPGCA